MESGRQQTGMESLHGASLLWSVLLVTVAAMVAAAALCLLPGLRIPQMGLPGWGRVALVVLVMRLGFSGVLVSTLLNLPDTTRWTLVVLFAAALLCSGYVALVRWFAVSGASSH
jgi:phosphatidylserine synthase